MQCKLSKENSCGDYPWRCSWCEHKFSSKSWFKPKKMYKSEMIHGLQPETKLELWKIRRVLDEMGYDSNKCIEKILQVEGHYDRR